MTGRSSVAQGSNLLYRGFPTRRRPIGGLGTPVGLPIRHRRPALKALGIRRLERCATLDKYLGRIAVTPQFWFFL